MWHSIAVSFCIFLHICETMHDWINLLGPCGGHWFYYCNFQAGLGCCWPAQAGVCVGCNRAIVIPFGINPYRLLGGTGPWGFQWHRPVFFGYLPTCACAHGKSRTAPKISSCLFQSIDRSTCRWYFPTLHVRWHKELHWPRYWAVHLYIHQRARVRTGLDELQTYGIIYFLYCWNGCGGRGMSSTGIGRFSEGQDLEWKRKQLLHVDRVAQPVQLHV